jgi:N-acetylglucosamine-6-phosphate deacetylase
MKTALTGATIFTGEEFLENHAVVLSGTGIEAVLPAVSLSQDIILTELPGGTLAPGFIDLQVNGGGGVLFNNDPSADCVRSIRDAHRSCGTTALLPTVISDSSAVREAAVRAVQECIAVGDEGVLGIHIEGPFLSAERRGVHQAEHLQTLSQADLDWLLGLGQGLGELPVMLTLAPEQVQAGDIARLAAGGIKVCAGHTAASYETTLAALREGLVGFTHLYNGMPPPAGREPGVVAAALEDSASWCGIICDGFHVDAALVRLAWRATAAG